MYQNVLYVFHDGLLCLTMFYVYKSPTISVCDRTADDRLRDCNNTAGIGDNSAEIGDDAAGIVDIAAIVIPC